MKESIINRKDVSARSRESLNPTRSFSEEEPEDRLAMAGCSIF